MEIKELKDRLNRNVESVCRELLPNGKKESRRWIVGNTSGDKGRSLSVPLDGNLAGQWQDFSTGEKGDLIDLWRLNRGKTLPDALEEIQRFLGISQPMGFSTPKRDYKKPVKPSNKSSSSVVKYLTESRGLTLETIKKFGIESDGEYYYMPFYKNGELIMWKKVSINRDEKGKKKMSVSLNAEPILFGWQAIDPNSRYVFITEGEIDAMSLTQLGFPALSVPFGAGNGNWITSEHSSLEQFEDIYLCFDNDEAGQAHISEFAHQIGIHRCFNVKLPLKDANECLLQGYDNEKMHLALMDYTDFSLDTVKKPMDFLEATINRFYPSEQTSGFPLPFGKKTELRFRPSEITLWTGTNGHGKSLVLGQVLLEMIAHGEKVFLASMELKPDIALHRMTRQATTMSKPSIEYITAIFEWWNENMLLYNVLGDINAEKLLETMVYVRQKYGVTNFVIDSMMKCGIGSDDFKRQKWFISALCDFRAKYDCHVHLVAHLRKGENEYKHPDKLDVSGTADITNMVDNQIIVYRNKAKEENDRKSEPDPKLEGLSDGYLNIVKHRNGEWEGKIHLWFDDESKQFLSYETEKAKRYVSIFEKREGV